MLRAPIGEFFSRDVLGMTLRYGRYERRAKFRPQSVDVLEHGRKPFTGYFRGQINRHEILQIKLGNGRATHPHWVSTNLIDGWKLHHRFDMRHELVGSTFADCCRNVALKHTIRVVKLMLVFYYYL